EDHDGGKVLVREPQPVASAGLDGPRPSPLAVHAEAIGEGLHDDAVELAGRADGQLHPLDRGEVRGRSAEARGVRLAVVRDAGGLVVRHASREDRGRGCRGAPRAARSSPAWCAADRGTPDAPRRAATTPRSDTYPPPLRASAGSARA